MRVQRDNKEVRLSRKGRYLRRLRDSEEDRIKTKKGDKKTQENTRNIRKD